MEDRPVSGTLAAEDLRAALMSRPGVIEDTPFGPGVLVYKLMGRMFALTSATGVDRVSLKCDPHLSEILRETFAGIVPGYHLNKRHWITVSLTSDVPAEEVLRLVGHSWDLVRAALPRKLKVELEGLCGPQGPVV